MAVFLKNKKIPGFSWKKFVDSDFILIFAALNESSTEESASQITYWNKELSANIGFDCAIHEGLELTLSWEFLYGIRLS